MGVGPVAGQPIALAQASFAPTQDLTPPHFHYGYNILSGLPEADLQRLRQTARTLGVMKGDVLFHRGDPADGCYWLRRGFLKIRVSSSRGEERILAVVGPGAIAGDLALLDGSPRAVNCQAMTDAHVLHISGAAVHSCLQRNPDLYEHLVTALMAQIRHVNAEAVLGTFLSARGRVARALLKLAASVGRDLLDGSSEICCPIRHVDIAAMASATRESVTRLLGEWRCDKLLQVSPEGKLIVDRDKLEKEVAQEA
jgi:CRP/FNR family transcriptional regulator